MMTEVKMQNPDYSKIQPSHFFSCEKEKTKFNWFAFELACEIDHAIPYKIKKRLSKKGYTRETFNKSCIKLAKLMQEVVLMRLRNEIPEMEISYVEAEEAFPDLDDETIDILLNYILKAWDNLLDVCVSCPTACVSNKDSYCTMFNDEFYYE